MLCGLLKKNVRMDLIFQLGNSLALVSWIVLLAFPKHSTIIQWLQYGTITLLAVAYFVLIGSLLFDFQLDQFSSIQNVQGLFQMDQMLVAGWFHYLAFDLFVGIYIVKEGIQQNWKRWQYSLCLPFTFLFGPVGLLAFYIIKLFKK
jgi:hypothetical protein